MDRTGIHAAVPDTGGVWDERGRQSDHYQDSWPHIRTQINQEEWQGSEADCATQGSSTGEIKPQTSD